MPVISVQSLACIRLREGAMLDALAMDLLLSYGAPDLWRMFISYTKPSRSYGIHVKRLRILRFSPSLHHPSRVVTYHNAHQIPCQRLSRSVQLCPCPSPSPATDHRLPSEQASRPLFPLAKTAT